MEEPMQPSQKMRDYVYLYEKIGYTTIITICLTTVIWYLALDSAWKLERINRNIRSIQQKLGIPLNVDGNNKEP